ncbi:MAG: Flp pilus assembly protein CpaB [Rhodospirillales bacterium 20-64-7]|nr:MAG: Flp pilus assembly protein CpaB [Rhodospirillales bacterium 20-64-7]
MVFRIGIFVFLIVGLIALSIFGISLLNQSKQQQAIAPPPTAQVLVASAQIQGGSLLQPSEIGTATVLASAIPVGAATDTPQNRSAIIGSMARGAITQGQPILSSELIHPGDHGFLAAVLAPGMRAVTVSVDAVTGANGLIWPGDRVDVLLTEKIPNAPPGKSIASEVVLSDVRVIATGQELIKGSTPNSPNSPNGPPAQTATLEVTPDQAARCLVAGNLGTLSLIVHSAATVAMANKPSVDFKPVWAGDVSHALSSSQPNSPTISTVHVFDGQPAGQAYNF